MKAHEHWINYERAVEDATQDLMSLTSLLERDDDTMPPELAAPAVIAEYALSDPLYALQEAQTWSQARSALLFWQQRWARAQAFVTQARPYAAQRRADGMRTAGSIAAELSYSNHALEFVLAELDARLVAFREIRPRAAAVAGRLAYLEHKHG